MVGLGRPSQDTNQEGDRHEEGLPDNDRRVRTGRTTPKKARPDAGRAAHEAAVVLPDTVTVAISELAGELEEGLLAFVVGTGLEVLDVVLESEATVLAGERGRHDPDRTAVRTEPTPAW